MGYHTPESIQQMEKEKIIKKQEFAVLIATPIGDEGDGTVYQMSCDRTGCGYRDNEEGCWNGKQMSEEYIKHGMPSCWAGCGGFRLIEEKTDSTNKKEKRYKMLLRQR